MALLLAPTFLLAPVALFHFSLVFMSSGTFFKARLSDLLQPRTPCSYILYVLVGVCRMGKGRKV